MKTQHLIQRGIDGYYYMVFDDHSDALDFEELTDAELVCFNGFFNAVKL